MILNSIKNLVLFFFKPSILVSSTQLLRDPFFILGICFMCYGWAILKKNKNNLGIVLILIGSVFFISMRPYLSFVLFAVFFFYSIKLILNKEISISTISLLIVPLFIIMHLEMSDEYLVTFFQKSDILLHQPYNIFHNLLYSQLHLTYQHLLEIELHHLLRVR